MEVLRDKAPTIIGVLVLILLCGIAYYLLVVESSSYYTRIDNSKVEFLSSNTDMQYQYTLISYNENDVKREIKFKTSRKLTEGAFIKMEVMITRGVTSWQEVSYQELPSRVREHYQE